MGRAILVVAGADTGAENRRRLLCRSAFVPVMQTTELRNCYDVAGGWQADRRSEMGASVSSERCVRALREYSTQACRTLRSPRALATRM
jgi:hypothetical protein